MSETNFDKLRSICTIEVKVNEETFLHELSRHHDQYLFLSKDNNIYAYIDLKKLATQKTENNDFSLKQITSNATSIEKLGVFNPKQTISVPYIFKILGEPIVLVKDNENKLAGYLRREDMLVEMFRDNNNINILKVLLASIPMGIFVVDHRQRIVHFNDTGLQMIRSTTDKVRGVNADSIFNGKHLQQVFSAGKTILNQMHITNKMGVLVDYSPIETKDGKVDGSIIIVQDLPMVENMAMEMESVKNLNQDMNAILSTIYDELLVVDHKGVLIRHSDNYIQDFWLQDLHQLVGKNILEFEEKGYFSPSVTRMVLERMEKVSVVQETNGGKKILSVGNPIFNDDGGLMRIIVASRDITENTKLKMELKETKEITYQYKQEISRLKNKADPSKEIIYRSAKMQKIINQIEKIADFSSTVLIQGETGVGKELIARAIHSEGNRFKKPFLTINCGAIPENLLESELFGYTKGAFTGADIKGKKGYFEQANGGVLFLDEIGDMPISLQVKLLRVLQEDEVVPIGSATPIPIDVQIVAATNKDLKELVGEGSFREDLYYRINVIPIRVPSLYERPEDIPLLAYHTLQSLNQRYNKNYHFSPGALNLLENYSWPGNIRELQNLIERLFVTADSDVINEDFVGQFMTTGAKRSTPVISEVVPLNKAKDDVEKQLVILAMEKYKSTTKAAKALGISQSAVSRKYKKISP